MTAAPQPPKLLPSAADILRCVREVTRDLIAPSLAGRFSDHRLPNARLHRNPVNSHLRLNKNTI